MKSQITTAAIVASLLALSACSSIPAAPKDQRAPADPWEPMNRQIHGFNTGFDSVTLKPIAQGYEFIFPQFLRTGIGNFSDNLRTPLSIINNFLQGKGNAGFSETGRLLVNSTVGIGGLFDVADEMGIEQHKEDFGQTFAVWGMSDGPYVSLPFFGPSTLRDGFAMPLNILADPLFWYDVSSVRDKIAITRLVDQRQRLFSAEKLLADSADPYISLRESYLQNRRFVIFDGDPPVDDDFYEEFDEEEFDDEEEIAEEPAQ